MAVFSAKRPTVWLALVPVLLLTAAGAFGAVHAKAPARAKVPITLDAQSFDGAANNLVFKKIRISQGDMSISADVGQAQGQGTKLADGPNFDNSLWTFRGNVKISLVEGQLTSDDAEIKFLNQQLSKAVANGRPATFEDRIEKTGKTALGRADTINYDAGRGIVTLAKNAWLSDGQTEVRGDSIKYNVTAQTILAEGADQESQRVHIVIPPPSSKP